MNRRTYPRGCAAETARAHRLWQFQPRATNAATSQHNRSKAHTVPTAPERASMHIPHTAHYQGQRVSSGLLSGDPGT